MELSLLAKKRVADPDGRLKLEESARKRQKAFDSAFLCER